MNKNLIAAVIFGGFAVAGGIQPTGNDQDAANTAPPSAQQQKAADETLNSSWSSASARQKDFEEQKRKVADAQARNAAEFRQLDEEYQAGKAKNEAALSASAANGEKIRQQYEAGRAKVDTSMAK
ncbi:hypothetical protein ACTNDZ_13480 [Selenomonas montiformis]|uniref:hypothetical protein n=1 Tax=Selenomonas montiformis TaxID=2652285 RepID=UPI003F8862E3